MAIWYMFIAPRAGRKADVSAWAKTNSLSWEIHKPPKLGSMSRNSRHPDRLGLSFEEIYKWFDRINSRQKSGAAKGKTEEVREQVRKHLDAMEPFQLRCFSANSLGYAIKMVDVDHATSAEPSSPASVSGH